MKYGSIGFDSLCRDKAGWLLHFYAETLKTTSSPSSLPFSAILLFLRLKHCNQITIILLYTLHFQIVHYIKHEYRVDFRCPVILPQVKKVRRAKHYSSPMKTSDLIVEHNLQLSDILYFHLFTLQRLHHNFWSDTVMKPDKRQRSKQRCQDLGWKVHDRAKSFVFQSYTMHELRNQYLVRSSVQSKQLVCYVHCQGQK